MPAWSSAPVGESLFIEVRAPFRSDGYFSSPEWNRAKPKRPFKRWKPPGFRAVRMLGDRDGYRFVEGLKVR